MRRITKRTTAIVSAAVLAVGGLGVAAYAANWFSGGGSANANTASAVPVSATLTAKSSLFPGATVDAGVTATNPNSYPVQVTGVTLNSTGPFTGPTGCTFANSKIQFNSFKPFVIPAKATSATSIPDVAGLLSMGKEADVACADAGSGAVGKAPISVAVTFVGEVA